jgi:hypothetical protein
MRRALVVLTFAITALSSTAALAQRYGYGWNNGPPQGPFPIRQGLVVGGSLGLGYGFIDCTGCSAGGVALDAHLGGMITPQLAIMGEVQGMAMPWLNGSTITHTALAAVVRYYLAQRWFLEGGLGVGHLEIENYDGSTAFAAANAFSALVAGGVEIVQSPRWSLNLDAREVSTFYNPAIHNFSLNLGIDWF